MAENLEETERNLLTTKINTEIENLSTIVVGDDLIEVKDCGDQSNQQANKCYLWISYSRIRTKN